MTNVTYSIGGPGDVGLHVVEHPDRPRSLSVSTPRGNYIDAPVPTDPAELHRLVEAILGRKVAAVIYEDELLPVVDRQGGGFAAGPALLRSADHVSTAWNLAIGYASIARHIEARDAATKERERAEEERRAGLIEQAKEAIRPLRFDPNTFITDVASLFVDNGWRPSSEEAGR